MRTLLRTTCKALEYAARAATWIRRPFFGDPTRILLENFTDAQRAAAAEPGPATAPAGAGPAKVLALVPFRDRIALTETCVGSLLRQRLGGRQLEVLLLDNGSVDPATAAGLARLQAMGAAHGVPLRVERIDEPFNYSRLNNHGVRAARAYAPDWLFFLNNDVEFPGENELAELLACAAVQPRLGALGCTLTYPDGRIQHLFVAPGIKIVATHPLKGRRLDPACAWFDQARPVPAVTGAALLVRAENFAEVGGFDETLPVVGQDVDLCLKLQRRGLVNWTCPRVRLIHHEGATPRGRGIDKAQVRLIYARWGDFLTANPYLSTRFSRFSEPPAYRLWEGAYPWERLLP